MPNWNTPEEVKSMRSIVENHKGEEVYQTGVNWPRLYEIDVFRTRI